MGNEPRLTLQTLKVLRVFHGARQFRASGADVMKSAKMLSGTVYPILARLEQAGWLEGEWEDDGPREIGRPRRRYYRLTGAGQAATRNAFAEAAWLFVPAMRPT